MSGEFLPVTMEECRERGIEQPDFVYVCGDAYVDHSSFGAAIICRLLESRGYSVGMIAQPDWKDPESIQVFGEPRLGFLISAGNMDSMVNHYTVSKKHRQKDAYSPGGEMGHRPDRAVIVYGNHKRRADCCESCSPFSCIFTQNCLEYRERGCETVDNSSLHMNMW